MSYHIRSAIRVGTPAMAALMQCRDWRPPSQCDAPNSVTAPTEPQRSPTAFANPGTETKASSVDSKYAGMQKEAQGDYHGLFPLRQLWQPLLEYPLWDPNWDHREPTLTGDKEQDRQRMRQIRKLGVTRHIILIRHGQYDETHKEDEKRTLTPLGRDQAHETGRRIAAMMKGAEDSFGPCRVKALRVSDMARAKETAKIIASHLPGIDMVPPDELLNEGRPCHHIPGGRFSEKVLTTTDDNHPRIEAAFQKYFYRAEEPAPPDVSSNDADNPQTPAHTVDADDKHEFEIIVCHANVIRYFLMRALQLPPEAWLRYCPFNCSLTYITIRPTGTVSCRMLGDIGHLPYQMQTFSKHHGFNW